MLNDIMFFLHDSVKSENVIVIFRIGSNKNIPILSAEMTKSVIVVLGSGAVGSRAAIALGKDPANEVVLVSPLPFAYTSGNYSHIYASLPPFLKQHAVLWEDCKQMKANVHQLLHGRAQSVDPVAKTVIVEKRDDNQVTSTISVKYDALIVATGCSDSYRKPAQVLQTDEWLKQLYENRKRMIDAPVLAFIGGGATSIALAIDFAQLRRSSTVSGKQIYVFCPQLLKAMPEKLQQVARDKLKQLGVVVFEGVRIKKTSEDLSSGRVVSQEDSKVLLDHADLIVWATGGKPNTAFLPKQLLTSQGYVKIDEYLRVEGTGGIFAAGDVAAGPKGPSYSTSPIGSISTIVENVKLYLKQQRNNDNSSSKQPKYSKANDDMFQRAFSYLSDSGDDLTSCNGMTPNMPARYVTVPYIWWFYGGRTSDAWQQLLQQYEQSASK